MATIFIDGFDKYGVPNTLAPKTYYSLNQGGWSQLFPLSGINAAFIVPGLAGLGGGAIQLGPTTVPSNNAIAKTLPNNFSRLIGGVRFRTDTNASVGIMFYDNATLQCFIRINQLSGRISLCHGDWSPQNIDTATSIADSLAAVAANTEHMLEWDINFGTNASYIIYLDGVQILSGLGLTIQTANSYANVFQLFNRGSSVFGVGSICAFDDLYMFDQTTSFNNSVLLANSIIFTDFPLADHQAQFVNNGNVVGNYFNPSNDPLTPWNFGNAGAISPAANSLRLQPMTPNVNCTIDSISIALARTNTSNPTAKFKGVIYADSSGIPGTLLSSGTEVVGYITGQPVVMPLASPQALTAGTQYWIGFINDSTFTMVLWDELDPANGGAVPITDIGQTANNTYASGAPSPAPAMTKNQASLGIMGICTGAATNWQTEAVNPPVGNRSSVSSSNVSDEDLYQYPGLLPTVTKVYTVAVSGNAYLSGPGLRQFDLVALSGAVESSGSVTGFVPTMSPNWFETYLDTDPNTGIAWTPTTVMNGFFGMELTA